MVVTEELYEKINSSQLEYELDANHTLDLSRNEISIINKRYKLGDVIIRQDIKYDDSDGDTINFSKRHAGIIFHNDFNPNLKFPMKRGWIHKTDDEWYFLITEGRWSNWECYKCDTFDGLIEIMDKLLDKIL